MHTRWQKSKGQRSLGREYRVKRKDRETQFGGTPCTSGPGPFRRAISEDWDLHQTGVLRSVGFIICDKYDIIYKCTPIKNTF
jgi:hypothetical protein